MKRPLREVLAKSHIAAVAIAVLFFWSLRDLIWVLLPILSRAIEFLVLAVAIQDLPYHSILTFALTRAALDLCNAVIAFYGAWAISLWVYGAGPFAILSSYRTRILRSFNV